MKIYEFVVTLTKGTRHTDDLVDALFEAGCADGSVWSHGDAVQVGFSREAESLEAAIRSAIADVQKAGAGVAEVTMAGDALSTLGEAGKCPG
jgi:hypothetical protein